MDSSNTLNMEIANQNMLEMLLIAMQNKNKADCNENFDSSNTLNMQIANQNMLEMLLIAMQNKNKAPACSGLQFAYSGC